MLLVFNAEVWITFQRLVNANSLVKDCNFSSIFSWPILGTKHNVGRLAMFCHISDYLAQGISKRLNQVALFFMCQYFCQAQCMPINNFSNCLTTKCGLTLHTEGAPENWTV